jgi:CHAT domain-containing protein
LIATLSSVGLYLFERDTYSTSRVRRLIQESYNGQRPGGGRLSGTPYTSGKRTTAQTRRDIGKAQVLLLSLPESEARLELQGRVYLATGQWQKFIDLYRRPPVSYRTDAQTLNNVGASFLALSEKDPSSLLSALDAFEKATTSDPQALEPLFNLVITYRKLHFLKHAEETLQRYSSLDAASSWQHELANPFQIDEAAIRDQLTLAVDNHNETEAKRLFEENPELCRRLVMQHALNNEPESEALMQFIAHEMETRYGDKTISAMLAPLSTDQRETIIAVRDFVRQGAELYTEGDYPASLSEYAEARRLWAKTGSIFDSLWIDLNLVNTQIRLGQFREARQSIRNVESVARDQRYIWVTARALTIYGYSLKLTDSYQELLDRVSEADRTFLEIGAPHDRIRTLYYLAARHNAAGDPEAALKLALECILLLTDDSDPIRVSTLENEIAVILYRRGWSERAVQFARQSVEEADLTTNWGVKTATTTQLAELYESLSQNSSADQTIRIAGQALSKMHLGLDRKRSELSLDLAKARLQLSQKNYADAESLLKRILLNYAKQPFSATDKLSQSLMLSGQVFAETGRIELAAKKFNEAIDVVENDDDYLKTEGLRVKFDDERRELYDSAIEFQLNSGSPDTAWKYVQKYRSKLFLEFLAPFNPNVAQTRAKLDRYDVQQRMPKDSQIVEYFLLKDKLLIWLITDKLFTMQTVDITRSALEDKVQSALQKLRDGEDADLLLAELGKILIGPVANLLDPNRVLVAIPDRALNGLSFPALRRPGKNQYLIEEFPIAFSPSLTYFLAANPNYSPQRRDVIVAFGSQNGGASELKELNAVTGIYSSARLYSGPQVEKSTFLAEMNKATIFHYAGHSVTDAVDPLRSSILLDGNRSGPNSVTAVDISQQRLPGNAVVILSSCDSSVGNSRDGIGVRGLTSAFLIGGASAVVGSLWQVEEASTAELMIRFHRAFANSEIPVAKALREAQLSFIHSKPVPPNPYYWSGFVVTGNFKALR